MKPPGRQLSKRLPAPQFKDAVVAFWTQRLRATLQARNNLSREDLEYVVQKIEGLRDERLKSCVATLIGWGDDERAELEMFCGLALEVMRQTTPSRLREAALRIELKQLMRDAK